LGPVGAQIVAEVLITPGAPYADKGKFGMTELIKYVTK